MNLLRKAVYLLLPVLIFMACEKDESIIDPVNLKASMADSEEIKMVPFKGNFVSVPLAPEMNEFVSCGINPLTDEPVIGALFNDLFGNATHLGVLGPESSLTALGCSIIEEEDMVFLDVDLEMIIKNKKGDGIKISGKSLISLIDGSATGTFVIKEGYRKFEGATGEVHTKGFFNLKNGVADFSGDGIVTQPNRNKHDD